MKKLFGLVLAVALVFTLVTIVPSSAVTEIFNLDYVKAVTSEGAVVKDLVGGQGVNDFGSIPIGATLGNLKDSVDAGAAYLYVVGWYLPPKAMTDIGVSIDGGEPVFDGYATSQQALNEAIVNYGMATADQAALTLRIDAYVPIQEGHHTVDFVAKFTDGSDKVVLALSYSNDNLISVGKPVQATLNTIPAGGGALISDNAFWNVSFVNDGVAPIFDGATTVPLGIYLSTTTEAVDARIYIDLQGVYKLSEVVVRSMGFNNIAFPQEYTVYVSETGDTWTEIGGDSGVLLNTWAKVGMFPTDAKARFIYVQIDKFNLLNDGNNLYYCGIGEVEAYGTKIGDATGKAPYEPYKNYTGSPASGDAGGYSAWTGFTTGDLDFDFSFKTDCSFYAIGFPAFWGYPGAPLTFEFFKDGSSVYSIDYTCKGDGPFVLDLGTTLEKGEYDVTMTINSEELMDDPPGAYKNYTVMGYAAEGILFDTDYFYFERGNVALDLYSNENTKLGFVRFDYVEPYEPESRDFDAAKGDALSFDQILVNGTEIANGNSAVIAAKKNIDGTEGTVETVTLHGWFGNAEQDIEAFGYQINGGEIVYGDYKVATEDAVITAGGQYASRFTMTIDVSELKGENVIWVWAKLSNGDEVQLNRFDNRGTDNEKDREIYVIYNGPADENPPTADASIVIFMVAAAAIALVLLKKKAFGK